MTSKIINLLAGPSAGKSTTAAGLFFKMKMAGHKVELVTEYAKELVYAERTNVLANDQLYMFAKQNHRLHNVNSKVDYIITDSSLLFSLVYSNLDSKVFNQLILETYNKYNNLNFFITRPDKFEEYGRVHNLEQSLEIDQRILGYLDQYGIEYATVPASESTVDELYRLIIG